MTKHFTAGQLGVIGVVAVVATVATLAVLFAPAAPETPPQKVPGTSSVSDSPAIVVDADGHISDTTGGAVNPLEPYFVGFAVLNGNPWGLTGTQVSLITTALSAAIVAENQAKPQAQWTTKVSLTASSAARTISDDGDIVTSFDITYNDAASHKVQFTIPLDYDYRLTLDGQAIQTR